MHDLMDPNLPSAGSDDYINICKPFYFFVNIHQDLHSLLHQLPSLSGVTNANTLTSLPVP
jgi:hypothetical protein